jgi:integrase
MASIEKRTTSDGQARYDVRYRDPTGRTRTKTFRRRKDADAYASTVEVNLHRGEWVDPNAGRLLFADYAASWVETRTTHRGKLAPRTVELYRQQLAAHILPTFGAVELKRITVPMVREWYSRLVGGGRPSVAAKCYRLLRAILATAAADDLIVKNPCAIKGAGLERSAERPVATAAQVWDLADAMPAHLRVVVLTAAFVGLRFSELAGLTRRDVDILHRTITVERQLERISKATADHLGVDVQRFGPPKSDAGYRTLSIPTPLVAELEDHLARFAEPGTDGLVFVGPKGGALVRSNFYGAWSTARTAVDLPGFRFHDLRHTHMTEAAATGASTKELMRRLGQSSPAAALRYQHATDSRDAEIADAVGERLARPRDGRAMGGVVVQGPGSVSGA